MLSSTDHLKISFFLFLGEAWDLANLVPSHKKHKKLCERFIEVVNQPQNDRVKRIKDTVLYVDNNEFKIGKGSAAKVYIGYHLRLRSWLAVKRYDDDEPTLKNIYQFIGNPKVRNQHTNIGSYLDRIEQDGFVFILMELYEETLETYLKREKPALATRRKLALGFLRGLEFLHKNQIVHRDIRPQNVLINEDDEVKIVDFGISRNLDLTLSGSSDRIPWLWIPPEAKVGEKESFTKKGEVFVAALMVFYIFKGDHPFCDLDKPNMEVCRDNSRFCVFQNELNDSFLQELLKAIFTIKVPSDRPSVSEMIQSLEESTFWKRSRIKKFAVLISCSEFANREEEDREKEDREEEDREAEDKLEDLPSAIADVTVLRTCLEKCGFKVIPRNNIPINQLMSTKLESKPIFEPLVDLLENHTFENEDILVYLHISTHGYYDNCRGDTILYFPSDNRPSQTVSVQDIVEGLKQSLDGIRECRLQLLLTVDACRKLFPEDKETVAEAADPIKDYLATENKKVEDPAKITKDLPATDDVIDSANPNPVKTFPKTEQFSGSQHFPGVFIFYSSTKGTDSGDPGGLFDSFACASPFSESLKEAIKPGKKLKLIIKDVIDKTMRKTNEFFRPEVDERSDSTLGDLVL